MTRGNETVLTQYDITVKQIIFRIILQITDDYLLNNRLNLNYY